MRKNLQKRKIECLTKSNTHERIFKTENTCKTITRLESNKLDEQKLVNFLCVRNGKRRTYKNSNQIDN